jgi:hypothetical protein
MAGEKIDYFIPHAVRENNIASRRLILVVEILAGGGSS